MFRVTLPTASPWLKGSARGFALSPDGSQIATGLDQVVIFDAKTGAQLGEPFGHVKEGNLGKPTIQAIAWVRSDVVAYSAAEFIGDVEAEVQVVRSNAEPIRFRAHRGGLQGAVILSDGRAVTAGREDKHVTVRSASGLAECELTGTPGTIAALSVSTDEKRVAVSTNNEILVWDLARCGAPTNGSARDSGK